MMIEGREAPGASAWSGSTTRMLAQTPASPLRTSSSSALNPGAGKAGKPMSECLLASPAGGKTSSLRARVAGDGEQSQTA